MNPITALIADDEEAPREQLRAALGRLWPELHIVSASTNGAEAWDDCLALEPAIAFLDIRMPGLTGLEVARRLSVLAAPPLIVFVTAFDDHALAAFDAGAIDYVLKPVDDARLAQSLARLRTRLTQPAPDTTALQRLLASLAPAKPAPRPIQAGVGREVHLIPPDEIVYFEADQRYTRVVHQGGDALIRTPLRELLTQLDPEQFWQIHRSVLVNSRCIARAIRVDEGTMVVTLRGRDEKLPVSRQFQVLFKGQ
ncbi:LytR/AlgR family response regulator transcription factor [Roseateles saccharophilus]|uniref:LytTR family two component transcriptional regulator n=1 Tax=Roseateles saccharophilus TaxID=304 RepID=A0A4R3VFU7_ROSSA|nr:LytTR family DNA-binding domain-containing protein [Roseateles saccharophilus]MDG0831167.1 response regulator transcription factor [Roseateles saccharophilus]TCV04287.1 LytTR family two component transcriptional regulator [Roseateles saccharophilus]